MERHLFFSQCHKALAGISGMLSQDIEKPELEDKTGNEIDTLCITDNHSSPSESFNLGQVLFIKF